MILKLSPFLGQAFRDVRRLLIQLLGRQLPTIQSKTSLSSSTAYAYPNDLVHTQEQQQTHRKKTKQK